jgi:hypothetical protein
MLDNKPKEHNKTMHNENPNPLARHRVFTGLVILAVATTIVGTNAGNAGKAVTTSNAASTAIAVNPAIPSSEAVGLDVYQATSASSIAGYVSFIGIAGAISGSTSNPATPDVKGTQKQ